jgi:hypothetical protein
MSSPANAGPSVNVHIETLVVEGLSVRGADQLGVTVQRELGALLSDGGLARVLGVARAGIPVNIHALRAPNIRTARALHAADAGAKISHAIHGGLRS